MFPVRTNSSGCWDETAPAVRIKKSHVLIAAWSPPRDPFLQDVKNDKRDENYQPTDHRRISIAVLKKKNNTGNTGGI